MALEDKLIEAISSRRHYIFSYEKGEMDHNLNKIAEADTEDFMVYLDDFGLNNASPKICSNEKRLMAIDYVNTSFILAILEKIKATNKYDEKAIVKDFMNFRADDSINFSTIDEIIGILNNVKSAIKLKYCGEKVENYETIITTILIDNSLFSSLKKSLKIDRFIILLNDKTNADFESKLAVNDFFNENMIKYVTIFLFIKNNTWGVHINNSNQTIQDIHDYNYVELSQHTRKRK